MHAGVIRSTYKKGDLNQVVKEYKESALPALASHQGSRSGMLLVDHDSGEAISIAIYEDEASAKAFAPKAVKLLESFKKYRSSTSEPKRELFEIATSTQQETKAVVERGLKAFNAHDLEAVARDSAPDIELTAPGGVKVKGVQGVKEYNQSWIKAFPDARIENKKLIAQGNTVVVEGTFSGTHTGPLKTPMGEVPPTGRKLKGDFIQVFEIDRGLVKRNYLMYDQVDVMTQLGMAPAGAKSTA
ncbi:MAG: ester cyclase [Chloroflexi bacterium]|nr:MAG: ester cyclase [Chloroflexota bacterium]